MRGDVMSEPRLLQVFLSRGVHGVFEVSITLGTGELLCTCPGYESWKTCKHVTFVKGKLGANGEYPVAVDSAAIEAVEAARAGTAADWRHFVYMHCPAEVI